MSSKQSEAEQQTQLAKEAAEASPGASLMNRDSENGVFYIDSTGAEK